MTSTRSPLFTIVLSQFCCTSLWFAGNAVMGDLVKDFGLQAGSLGHLTSAVQFGFITGTLVFALLTIADRYSPSKVFLISALLGSMFNAGVIWEGNTISTLLILRFLTGFFLAGIYPIGMKIAADHYEKGLGTSLGFLVGALVLGTAFPHLLKALTSGLPWRMVLMLTTCLAIFGGLLMKTRVSDGPYRKAGQKLKPAGLFTAFQDTRLRAATFGYFGHMWELYTFWAFVPVMLTAYVSEHSQASLHISAWSFAIIAIGGPACVAGGYLSKRWSEKRTAALALSISGLCCILSLWFFHVNNSIAFLSCMLIWGMSVVADSPLFSTLVARHAQPEIRGTILTMVNCIGFAITIVSIQVMNFLKNVWHMEDAYWILALGPALGLIGMFRKKQKVHDMA